jgi:hypothetical protein
MRKIFWIVFWVLLITSLIASIVMAILLITCKKKKSSDEPYPQLYEIAKSQYMPEIPTQVRLPERREKPRYSRHRYRRHKRRRNFYNSSKYNR